MGNGEQLLQVANRISSLKHEWFGKGPARARAYLDGDFVFVVLEGGFIDAEQTLIGRERDDAVRAFRQAFEEVTRAEMTRIVEEAMRSRVLDYMSQVLTRTGVVVEIFQLARAPSSA